MPYQGRTAAHAPTSLVPSHWRPVRRICLYSESTRVRAPVLIHFKVIPEGLTRRCMTGLDAYWTKFDRLPIATLLQGRLQGVEYAVQMCDM